MKGSRSCPLCAASGAATEVEEYRGTPLKYCTFHHWLLHGRTGNDGYSLQDYVDGSMKFMFAVSLPSAVERERMLEEYDSERRSGATTALRKDRKRAKVSVAVRVPSSRLQGSRSG